MRLRAILLTGLMILSAVAVMPGASAGHNAEPLQLYLSPPEVPYYFGADGEFVNGELGMEVLPEEDVNGPPTGVGNADWFLRTPWLTETPATTINTMAIVPIWQDVEFAAEDFGHGNWVTPQPYTLAGHHVTADLSIFQPSPLNFSGAVCGASDMLVYLWASPEGTGGTWTKVSEVNVASAMRLPLSIPIGGVPSLSTIHVDMGAVSVQDQHLMLTVSGFHDCGHMGYILYGNEALGSRMTFTPPAAEIPELELVIDVPASLPANVTFAASVNGAGHALDAWSLDLDGDGTPEFGNDLGHELPLAGVVEFVETGDFAAVFRATLDGEEFAFTEPFSILDPASSDDGGEATAPAGTSDADADNIADEFDNCPSESNPHQSDADRDGLGDACDEDADGDNVRDDIDNCIGISNDQSDIDGDDLGDACDDDIDGDGTSNSLDLCPTVFDDGADMDGDGIGDACESDRDGDGIDDSIDRCPDVRALNNEDLDGDGLGDVCDDDIDGDGSRNDVDNCPRHDNRDQADLDGDRLGDACDADINGDGIVDNFAAAGVPGGAAPADMEALLSVDDKESPGFGLVALIAAIGAVLALRRR